MLTLNGYSNGVISNGSISNGSGSNGSNHCITVCGKWIFDSNLESALPLKKASLNYICSGNDTDEITFVGVLNAIRAVPPTVSKEN